MFQTMVKMPQVKRLAEHHEQPVHVGRVGVRDAGGGRISRGWVCGWCGVGGGRDCGRDGEDLGDWDPVGHVFAFGEVGEEDVAGGDVTLEIFEGVGAVELAFA